jgi:uncharacterized protein
MHINVSDILAESVGYSRDFTIADEHPRFEDLSLAASINGHVSIMRLENGLAVRGRITTEVELQCDRCLRSFHHPVTASLRQVFTDHPSDDELPIEHNNAIDLAPLIGQEVVLALPIKQLCQPDCPGIAPAQSGRTSSK